MSALFHSALGRSFHKWFLGLALLLPNFGAYAQVPVSITDDSGSSVPYAHIAWQPLTGGSGGLVVMDVNGRGQLPLGGEVLADGILIRVSFVGYDTAVDTLYRDTPLSLQLQRSLLSLPEVVITGQYAPVELEKAVQKVRVLDETYFERIAASNLGDALRNELNIRLSQDNILGTSMSMQGLGGQNVKILIDGVPVIGRQDGNVDLAQMDLTGIERAEIVEGPLSVNYGTNALAGTINLITRKGGGRPATLKALVYTEQVGRLNTTLNATRHWKRNDVVLTAGRNFFDGWDPRDQGMPDLSTPVADSTRYQQWKPREQYFGRLNYRWIGDRWTFGYKGEIMHDRILNRGKPRPPYHETAFDEEYVTIRLDNAVHTEAEFTGGRRFSGLFAHNRYQRTRNTWFTDLTTMGEQLVDADGMQDTTLFTLTNARLVYAIAPDSSVISFETGLDLNHETGSGERIGEVEQSIGDLAAYGSLEWTPVAPFTIRPGVRYAYNTRFDAPLIPSLNVRWKMNKGFILRASYAQGFRAPSLKELYLYFVDVNHDITGNPDLRPERSHNLNVGLTYRHAKEKGVYTSEISGFYNDIDELITLAQISVTSYSYVNIGDYRTMGGSVGAGWDNGHWVISVGGSLTGRIDALSEARNEPVLFSPELRASVTKQWLRKGWSASFFWKYQGELSSYVVVSDVELERGFIAPFQLADASVTKRIWKERLGLTVGCKDLFNVGNVNASVVGGAHSNGATSVPMTTGRTAFFRVELDLKKNDR
ncbi:MAG: TonB-dependent receptor [Flavobacteriales bacterium]|nr:TonB-dependent receptor [Flavobacteriales bacterium]